MPYLMEIGDIQLLQIEHVWLCIQHCSLLHPDTSRKCKHIALYFPLNRNYFQHLNHLSSKHTTCTLLSFLKPNHYSASYDKWTKRALFSWHYFLMLFAKQQECLSWPGEEKIKEIRAFLKTGYKAERIIQVINSLWLRGLLQRRSHPDWILIFFFFHLDLIPFSTSPLYILI